MASRLSMDANVADGDGLRKETAALDMSREGNYAAVLSIFEKRFGRAPLLLDDPDATINDLILWRMIDPHWSQLERALVDKTTAKAAAQSLCPDLRAPATLATIEMDEVRSASALYEVLAPFAGMSAIAKPAQASGGAVFLRTLSGPQDVTELHDLATHDYAHVMREMQYAQMPRRVMVESLIPTADGTPPDDFKFHCIRGEPLLCQIDHARFGAAWSRVLRLPDFAPLDPEDGQIPPATLAMAAPDRLAAMIAAARALSAPFEYARIDLYAGVHDIYFGEVTFTPAASLGIAPSAAGCSRVTPTHRLYSTMLMDAYRRG